MGDRVRLADHVGRGFDREPTLRRLAVLAIVCSFFAFGFTQCGTPTLTCSNPKVLTDYHGTIQYSAHSFVQQDVWQEVGSQTMYVCSAQNWKAVATQSGAPATGVKTFPDSEYRFTDYANCSSQPTLGSFSKLSSSFHLVGPNAGSWDSGLDIFVNGGACPTSSIEVMALTRWRAVDFPAAQLHPIFGGVQWDLQYSTAARFYQFRRHIQTDATTVDVLAMFRYLESKGFLKASDTMVFVQGGHEILTTSDNPLPFWLTGFSVSAAF